MSTRILVTGASGKVGTATVKLLQEQGVPVRAAVHDPEKARHLEGPDTQIVPFDFDNADQVKNALNGVSAVCMITPPHYMQVEWATNLIDRAVESGVTRIVRLSVRVADMAPSSRMSRWHKTIEQHLKGTRADWTIIRPTPFWENFMGLAPRSPQGYFFPLTEDARVCHMDLRDAAKAMVKTLTESGHSGKTYTLTATQSQSFHAMCETMEKTLGRPFPCHYTSPEMVKQSMDQSGAPDWLGNLVIELFTDIITPGHVAKPDPGEYEALVGEKPTDFLTWVKDHADTLPRFNPQS
jgi:uncharacterized protein YbjT (DUF2867 family)